MYFNYRCEKCGNVIKSYITCKKRTCSHCARIRSAKLVKVYTPIVEAFEWPAFMTLTLPWVKSGEVKKWKGKLVRAFAKMRTWKRLGIQRGIYAIEILKKDGDFWYLHLHAVVDSKWIDQRELSEAWLKASEVGRIVHIRRIFKAEKACIEILKYQTKMWELTQDEKIFVDDVFRHSRFVGSFGITRPKIESHPQTCTICGGKMLLFEDDAYFRNASGSDFNFDDG